MNIRDLPYRLIKKLAADGEQAFKNWWNLTQGRDFRSNEPIEPKEIFKVAFSNGASAVLKRIDEIKKR
jgi:hypothetical protein